MTKEMQARISKGNNSLSRLTPSWAMSTKNLALDSPCKTSTVIKHLTTVQ